MDQLIERRIGKVGEREIDLAVLCDSLGRGKEEHFVLDYRAAKGPTIVKTPERRCVGLGWIERI